MKSFQEFLTESKIQSKNKGYGYHGTLNPKIADKKYEDTVKYLKDILNVQNNVVIIDYLDSTRGRHLTDDLLKDKEYLKKNFKQFIKTYDPRDYE